MCFLLVESIDEKRTELMIIRVLPAPPTPHSIYILRTCENESLFSFKKGSVTGLKSRARERVE